MSIKLDWKNNNQTECMTTFNGESEKEIDVAIEACIEKAVSFFPDHVTDDSRYFLFEWKIETSILTIVVTDDAKQNDANFKIQCCMSALNDTINNTTADIAKNEIAIEHSDLIKYSIKDYLTTCAAFMQYSLVAVFHNKSRDKVELL
jgi:hypothetical protein